MRGDNFAQNKNLPGKEEKIPKYPHLVSFISTKKNQKKKKN